MFPRRAAHRLREHTGRLPVVLVLRIEMLCGDIRLADPDGFEFVLPDAAREDLLLAGRRVETPPAAVGDDRNGERPLLVAHDERPCGTGALQVPLLVHRDVEDLLIAPRGRRIRRVDERTPLRSEDRRDLIHVAALDRGIEGADGIFGSRERLLVRRSTVGTRGEAARQSDRQRGVEERGSPGHARHYLRRLPLLRDELRLRCPRWLAARSDLPLE